jgi:NADH-quinone oxidoreductase subunit L
MKLSYLIVPFAPLIGAILAGLFGEKIGRRGSHGITILGVAISFIASIVVAMDVANGNMFNGPLYRWMTSGGINFEVGFLIDRLTVTMMLVVTSVSLMVHIYTIGYMADDPGYQRFFSYISLFTFSMLMLVMSNNLMQLFFGWEAVGLVSYLLIGFWYTRPTAIYANLKAFLVNRVGDFGFLLGIGLIAAYADTMDYAVLFEKAPELANKTIELFSSSPWSLVTVTCICLFIGAMGKSAQVPLHVWLPDSMEGPTPISALIHAATMVTAGIFMVARMSPLFELSDTALSFVLIIGSITALFMGLLGIIQNDIKRVVAYSTLSQLGYMTVALGASAYSVAIFHLMTHAFFKALLFLGAGSVIMGMHHEQDIRKMGGLWKYMKVTWITSLIGSLALIGFPFFSGFYSKDSIIEVVHASKIYGSGFANFAVLAGVFITAFYSFRMYFLVFHGKERFRDVKHDAHHDHGHGHHGVHEPHESPWVVTLPLILLAIPSALIGLMLVEPMAFGKWFGSAISVNNEAHPAIQSVAKAFKSWDAMALHGIMTLPFGLAMLGVGLAAFLYLRPSDLPEKIARTFSPIYKLLENKYYFDRFNEVVFAAGSRALGSGLSKVGDKTIIDGGLVNGSAALVGKFAALLRNLQTGQLYVYAFMMLIGVVSLIAWWQHIATR